VYRNEGDLNVTNQFQIARDKAEADRAAILMEQDAAVKAATEKVRASFAARLSAATNEFNRCATELLDHIEATATHEWEGKRVSKVVIRYRNNWGGVTRDTFFGIIEVRRLATVFPANSKYGIPPIGKAFVRLLKKDGTLGKSFDGISGWSLVKEI
jgi:hypothetical protein